MASDAPNTNLNKTAKLAGALYLAIMPFGFFGVAYVPSKLYVAGDPAATAEKIAASEWLFRTGIVSQLICQVIFIVLVLTLYRLLNGVNKPRAQLMAVLALLSVPVAMLGELNHLAALTWLGSAADGAFTQAQLQAQAMSFLDLRWQAIFIAQIFWGLWLLPLGGLVFKSGFLPRWIGVLLTIAGTGYVIDSATQILSPGFPLVSPFTFAGEVVFTLWLLVKGAKPGQSTSTYEQSPAS